MTGITLSAYGFSSFVFSLLSTWLVNPDDEPCTTIDDECIFDPAVANRVPYMIRTLGYMWIGLVFVSVFLISRPQINIEEMKERIKEDAANEEDNINKSDMSKTSWNASGPAPEEKWVIKNAASCIYSLRFW